MAKYFAGGHLRFVNGEWRDDNGDAIDAVVVTRCKDCEYLVNTTINANGFLICDISDMEIAPDDFCSYGERREE